MPQSERIDPRVLGQRLAEARKARGVTQEEAAQHLGYSRPTLIAIEKGERPAKPPEIVKLAAFYGRQVHELVRGGEPLAADLQPHLRAAAERMQAGDGELVQAIADLQRWAGDYRELERIMNAPLRYNYPPEVPLADSRIDVVSLAEDVAGRERQRLGLGDQPILNLRSVLEWDVGLRIFYRPLPSALAGMYAYAEQLGCCILINVKHPASRRRASMVHEYGHLIVDRYKPGIDYHSYPGRKPANERFAESFAMSFLMPASSVRHRFHDIVATTRDFQVADLVHLSHFYFVSVPAMALRLEGLGLLPRGTADMLKEEKLHVGKANEILELPSHHETNDPFPERYKYLAVHAYERGEISEGQLARFLRCEDDPVRAREIVQECLTTLELAADGRPLPVQLEFQRSLLSHAH
jgi:Zn-dependent peptidase ImmA (M78 family)/DNA-binding XRE family transcriptional regulator